MKFRELIEQWEEQASEVLSAREYRFRLPLADAARVAALADLYPRRDIEGILTDLVGAALDEVERAFPYVQGARVIAEDDQGDPIYEDAGPAARFRELTREHAAALAREAGQPAES